MSAFLMKKKLNSKATRSKAQTFQRFFKTGSGEYGEGDLFIGVTMPEIRKLASEFAVTSHQELTPLLNSPVHEERMLALVILTLQFKLAQKRKDNMAMKETFEYYFRNRHAVNNWDLVDVTAPVVVGGYLFERNRRVLRQLSGSNDLWERRIAIVSTFYFIRQKDFRETLWIAKKYFNEEHDLIHKATGWMLRELGKRDERVLREFLDKYSSEMPRTMLRYSIERLPERIRKTYLKRKI